MDELRENMFLERWIKAELRIDQLQEQIDILREQRINQSPSAQLAQASRHILALRGAILLHRQSTSPIRPDLAGAVDQSLWAILDVIPEPMDEDLLDE